MPTRELRFTMVDVFPASSLGGNALAVVHDADDLTDDQMAAFARWTNLSETTFLLAPATPDADYRVRIWTTGGELPFAGHPTLGSAAAWVGASGRPAREGSLRQECGAGIVEVRMGERYAFAAPPLVRSGPVDVVDRSRVLAAVGLGEDDVLDVAWIDNGPGWIGVECRSADVVLGVRPDVPRFDGLKVTLLGRHASAVAEEIGADVEVRAFYADGRDFSEDPVTGSANAGLAQWLIGAGRLPDSYVARQGTVVDRDGRVFVDAIDGHVWIGGSVRTHVTGSVVL